VDTRTGRILCVAFANGRTHDFRLFKRSKVRILPRIESVTDTGYLGIAKLHGNSTLPKKRGKKHPLSQADKAGNRAISSRRALNENVIGRLQRFKIIADTYRNRRRRFGLRFSLIAGICNHEIR
jgi:hypothetical protein